VNAPDVHPPHLGPRPPDDPDGGDYVLRLFVTGMTPRSTEAIARLKAICEKYLEGRYELEIIDIYQQPSVAKNEQIIATPTLIKKLPSPLRRLVGDLSDTRRVLLGLNIQEK
jgi:circadian clock protein KaiB